MSDQRFTGLAELVRSLNAVTWKERDAISAQLRVAAFEAQPRVGVVAFLIDAAKDVQLEVRWEIDEIVEALAPPPEPEAPPDPNKPLAMSDLNVVYDDPRGILLHKSKVGDRWFLTQPDPRTGRPQMFELHAAEVAQVKEQLRGSPHWVLGSGENPAL